MTLSAAVIDQIRTEIGPDLDVTDDPAVPPAPLGDLESIFENENQGNFSVLRTAYVVWKKRLAAISSRSFDATAGGSLMARSQRARFIQRRVKELEILIDFTQRGREQEVLSKHQAEDGDTEFASLTAPPTT